MKPVKAKPADTSVAVIISALEKQAKPWQRKIEAIAITTQHDYDTAALLMSNLKQLAKQAKAEEAKITSPLKQAMTATVQHFKPFYDRVFKLEAEVKERMVAFIESQEAKVIKLHQDFESGKIKKVGTVVAQENKLLNVSNENASVRQVKKLVIKDIKKIPREYLVPDEFAITNAIKAGRLVPGCELVNTKTIAI